MTSPTFSHDGETILLAFDTSAVQGSVALSQNSRLVSQYGWDKKSTHSEIATLEASRLLKDQNLTFKDLTRLSVNVGPGSFTGLRVGLNIVRTLAYALSLPVAVFNSLELLAFRHGKPGDRILVAAKAVQNFYYTAAYEYGSGGLVETMAPRSHTDEEVRSKSSNYTKVLIESETSGPRSWPQAVDQIEFLHRWPQSVGFFPWTAIKPLYIRASEAEEKMRRGLLKPL
jgi:tRNA threonylcarbamoyl adenosine modification protein YeaZ